MVLERLTGLIAIERGFAGQLHRRRPGAFDITLGREQEHPAAGTAIGGALSSLERHVRWR